MENLENPGSAGVQVAAGSVESGGGIIPFNDTVPRTSPHNNAETSHPYKESQTVNAGLGAQSIDGGTVLEGEQGAKKEKKKKCIVQ